MGGGQGTGANATGTNQNTNQNSQGAGSGDGSNDDAPQYVLKADFDTLATKLDAVLADNKRYRDDRRKQRGQNQGGNGGGQGDESRDDSDNGTNEMATLRNQLRQANFRTDITTAAIKAGALVPEDMHRLLSIDDADIDVDELGYVKNADAAIAALKTSRPQYFGDGKPTVNGGADGGSGSNNRQRRNAGNTFSDQLRRDIQVRTGRG